MLALAQMKRRYIYIQTYKFSSTERSSKISINVFLGGKICFKEVNFVRLSA